MYERTDKGYHSSHTYYSAIPVVHYAQAPFLPAKDLSLQHQANKIA